MGFLSADVKNKNITSQLFFFHRPTVLTFWLSVLHRPKISHSNSADCRAIIGDLSADNRPMTFLSADHLQTKLIVGRRSADDRPIDGFHKPHPHISIVSMYTYLDIFASSECFLLCRKMT